MSTYRCYLLTPSDLVHAAVDLEAYDDAEAMAKAPTLVAMTDEFPAFEVWQGERLVGRVAGPLPS